MCLEGTSIHQYPVFTLLKQNRVIIPDEIYESYPGKKIYRKYPKFSDRSPGQMCKLISACSLGIGLIRVYTVAVPSVQCCRTAITGQY